MLLQIRNLFDHKSNPKIVHYFDFKTNYDWCIIILNNLSPKIGFSI